MGLSQGASVGNQTGVRRGSWRSVAVTSSWEGIDQLSGTTEMHRADGET